jgi:hypothetical protein
MTEVPVPGISERRVNYKRLCALREEISQELEAKGLKRGCGKFNVVLRRKVEKRLSL